MESTAGKASPLDRFLRLFTDVKAGESGTVLLMLFNVFVLLVCYYVIKTIREPLILEGGGAVVKSYAAAGQALILMLFVPLYGWFASRVSRMKLIVGVTLFFAVNVELFSLAVAAQFPWVGVVFFIWVGFFSLTVIAQFWSYANDIYTKAAGDRLFALIGVGATAGSPLGSFLAGHLFATGVKPHLMLHISTALLLLSLLLYWIVNQRESRLSTAELADKKPPDKSEATLGATNGFMLVFRSRYLRLIALLFILLNLVNTTGEYLLGTLVVKHAELAAAADAGVNKAAVIGSFYGEYFFWVNIIAVLMQLFLVSRIVKYLGIAGALLALPIVAFGAYGIIAVGAGFAVVRWAKTAENCTDYSIMNTARQLLWLPTSREEKYKAKQAVDTFFVRLGDVLSALVVFVGTAWLGLSVAGFALGNLVLIVIWLGVAWLIIRENRRLVAASSEEESEAA